MECQNISPLLTTVISVSIPALISVIGWSVVNGQNRKMRKEEAQRAIYDKLYNSTDAIIDELSSFQSLVNDKFNSLRTNLEAINKMKPNDTKRNTHLNNWLKDVRAIINTAWHCSRSIEKYMRILDMGGTNFGRESKIFDGLKIVTDDTGEALTKISSKWVNYTNFDNMTEWQFKAISEETKDEMRHIEELKKCLDDVLTHAYNAYVATPLQLPKRQIANKGGRRYIAESGIKTPT